MTSYHSRQGMHWIGFLRLGLTSTNHPQGTGELPWCLYSYDLKLDVKYFSWLSAESSNNYQPYSHRHSKKLRERSWDRSWQWLLLQLSAQSKLLLLKTAYKRGWRINIIQNDLVHVLKKTVINVIRAINFTWDSSLFSPTKAINIQNLNNDHRY